MKPLKLPNYKILGVSDSTQGGLKFDLTDYSWFKKPAVIGDIPICWTREQSYLMYSDLYPDVESFAALSEENVFVDPVWGLQKTPIKRPKCILLGNRPASLVTPEKWAVQQLLTQLQAANIFVTKVRNTNSVSPHTLVRMGGLHYECIEIFEASIGASLPVLSFNENHFIGGEILIILTDTEVSAFPLVPYYFEGIGALPNIKAYDLDTLQRITPCFDRVKILFIQGGNQHSSAEAIIMLESFIDEAPANLIEYYSYPGHIYFSSSPSYLLARQVIKDKIIEFFGLTP